MTRQVIAGDLEHLNRIEEFKTYVSERQRFLVFSGKLQPITQVIKYETDEKICYFMEELRPRFGTKGFVQKTVQEGFSYNKSEKKLSIWFGKSITKISRVLIGCIMTDLGAFWYTSMNDMFRSMTTRMILEKVIRGKINNPREYVESYVKCHLRIKGVSHELYYDLFEKMNDNNILSVGSLNEILRHSKDPNWVINNCFVSSSHFGPGDWRRINLNASIIQSCKILGRKFDWSLSEEDTKKESIMMTKEIEGYEWLCNNG